MRNKLYEGCEEFITEPVSCLLYAFIKLDGITVEENADDLLSSVYITQSVTDTYAYIAS